MIKVVAKNFIQEDKFEEVIELYKELIKMTRKEEGCIKYEIFQDEKDSSILTMIEEWENRRALEIHMTSEHFTRIVPKLRRFRRKETDINVYNKLI